MSNRLQCTVGSVGYLGVSQTLNVLKVSAVAAQGTLFSDCYTEFDVAVARLAQLNADHEPTTSFNEPHWKESLLSAGSHRVRRWRGTVSLVAIVILIVAIAQTSIGHAILRRVGLSEQPTNYTSLAFTQPQSLPEQLSSRRTEIGVSFIIHNADEARHNYNWSMLLFQTGHTRRVASGKVSVPPGNGAAITQSARFLCAQGRVQVIVRLAYPAESIDAWMSCPLRGS